MHLPFIFKEGLSNKYMPRPNHNVAVIQYNPICSQIDHKELQPHHSYITTFALFRHRLYPLTSHRRVIF